MHWYLDPANHKEVIEISPASPSSPPNGSPGCTPKGHYRDPNMMPDLAALQRNVDLTRDLGFIKASSRSTISPISAWCRMPPSGCNRLAAPRSNLANGRCERAVSGEFASAQRFTGISSGPAHPETFNPMPRPNPILVIGLQNGGQSARWTSASCTHCIRRRLPSRTTCLRRPISLEPAAIAAARLHQARGAIATNTTRCF